jgi:hypothetical protein
MREIEWATKKLKIPMTPSIPMNAMAAITVIQFDCFGGGGGGFDGFRDQVTAGISGCGMTGVSMLCSFN